jgi:hypothetical protein
VFEYHPQEKYCYKVSALGSVGLHAMVILTYRWW